MCSILSHHEPKSIRWRVNENDSKLARASGPQEKKKKRKGKKENLHTGSFMCDWLPLSLFNTLIKLDLPPNYSN